MKYYGARILFLILMIIFVGIPVPAQAQFSTPIPRTNGPEGTWCALTQASEPNDQCGFTGAQTACEQSMENFYPADTDILRNVVPSDSGGLAVCETDAATIRGRSRSWIGDPVADRRCLEGTESGGQCTPLSNQTSHSSPTCSVSKSGGFNSSDGNPVDLLSGTKIQDFTDFVTADGRLKFSRAYASKSYGTLNNGTVGILGRAWSVDYLPRLMSTSTARYTLFLPGHQAVSIFCLSGGCEMQTTAISGGGRTPGAQFDDTDTEFSGQLSEAQNNIPFVDEGGMTYIFKSEEVEGDMYFTIRRIEYPGGYSIDYDTRLVNEPFSPIRFLVEKMTDSFGREITLEYGQETWQDPDGNTRQIPVDGVFGNFPVTTGFLQTVTLPDLTTLHFSYDTVTDFGLRWGLSERLASVERVSAANNLNNPEILSREIYHYKEPSLPFALTGITDTAGVRYSSWEYSEDGLAISSEHAGGVERYEFNYDHIENALIPRAIVTSTNPLGRDTIYTPHALGTYFSDIDGQASSNCVADVSSVNNNSSRMTLVDKEGRTTRMDKNEKGWTIRKTEAFRTDEEVVTSTDWHPVYRLPTRRERPGLIDERVYDEQARMISMTLTDTTLIAASPRTWTYTYEGPNVTSIDGPLPGSSDTQFFTYNQERLTSLTNEVGHLTRITDHNAIGAPIRIIDPNGIVTILGYDSEHKLTSITVDPLGRNAVTRLTYNAVDNVTSVTSPNGTQVSVIYDDARRVIGLRNNEGEAIDYVLNPMGGVLKTEMSGEAGQIAYVMNQVLDERNRIIEMTKVGGQGGVSETSLAYDRESNLVEVNDARNNTWENQFDNLDRLVKEIDPLGAETDYGLTALSDGRNPLETVTDAREVTTNYVRNGYGEVMREVSLEAGIMEYVRDERGLVTQMTDARGVITNYAYDAAGRLLSETYPSEALTDIFYTYDQGPNGIGQLTTTTESFGATTYTYDKLYHMTSMTRLINGQSYSCFYTYDLSGEILTETYPSGRTIRITRDKIARIVGLESRAPNATEFEPLLSDITYAPFGPLTGAKFADGHDLELTYDTAYRAKSLRRTSSNGALMDFSFDHDDEGDIIAMTDNVRPERSQSFGYDPISRMTSAVNTGVGGYGSIGYDYNLVGDRMARTVSPVGGVEQTDIYSYDPATARLSDVTPAGLTGTGSALRLLEYNASGQVISDTRRDETGPALFTYGINARERMITVSQDGVLAAAYTYDSTEQRIVKAVSGQATIHYHYDGQGRLISETDGATGTTLREYIWLGLTPIASYGSDYDPEDPANDNCSPALREDLAVRLLDVKDRLAFVKERAAVITGTLDIRTARQATIAARKAELNAILAGVPETNVIRIDALTARIDTLETRIADLADVIENLGTRIEDLSVREDNLNAAVTRISDRIERLNLRCDDSNTAAVTTTGGTNVITLSFLHSDHLGRPKFATRADGTVSWDGGIITPFGVQITTLAAQTQALMFPGQYDDTETTGAGASLSHNWHRTYDPMLGRYLQADPIGLAGGLNRYAYVGGNPMNAIDFEGLAAKNPGQLGFGEVSGDKNNIALWVLDEWTTQGEAIVKCGKGAPPNSGDLDFFVIDGLWYKIKDGTANINGSNVSAGAASSIKGNLLIPRNMRVYPAHKQALPWHVLDALKGGGSPAQYLLDLSSGRTESEDCSCTGILNETRR